MPKFSRRRFLKTTLAGSTAMALAGQALAQATSLSDVGGAMLGRPEVTIYTAAEIVTMADDQPAAQAVAVAGDRILATGTLEEVQAAIGDQPHDHASFATSLHK